MLTSSELPLDTLLQHLSVWLKRSNCFHKHGHEASCSISSYPYMIIFAVIQIVLSQIPNFHKLSWLSILAAVMSFTYASIGLGLSIAKDCW
ncbi:amino acid permease 6, partial [Nicotiana attenuata]